MQADICGTVQLDDNQRHKILDFINRHSAEHKSAKLSVCRDAIDYASSIYCIYPHKIPFFEENGRYARIRFSCAGFVLEAYKRAKIHLVNEDRVPYIDLNTVKQCYPHYRRRLDDVTFRVAMGLVCKNKWRILLCGYLFHGIDSNPKRIPYTPHPEDAFYY